VETPYYQIPPPRRLYGICTRNGHHTEAAVSVKPSVVSAKAPDLSTKNDSDFNGSDYGLSDLEDSEFGGDEIGSKDLRKV
jgi:hypothetical protein